MTVKGSRSTADPSYVRISWMDISVGGVMACSRHGDETEVLTTDLVSDYKSGSNKSRGDGIKFKGP